MGGGREQLRYISLLTLLMSCALVLSGRIVYLFLADAQRFPIKTVKIAANYQRITREQIQDVLSHHLHASFFALPVGRLHHDLVSLDWSQHVTIERIWPDTLHIVLIENLPIASWNGVLMTATGALLAADNRLIDSLLPKLSGPAQQQTEVLQIYQKLSKLLSTYPLRVARLRLRDNQAWELCLTNAVQLYLGKREYPGNPRLVSFHQ